MQVKKDEMKKAILKSGEKEFLDKGYEKASIRKIVKEAGTTIGNFYNYFSNKESLFDELVKDDLGKFMTLIDGHSDEGVTDEIWNISDPIKWRAMLKELIVDFLPEFSKGLVILLDCSEGTKYENSRRQLINFVKEHFVEHLEEFNASKASINFAPVLAEQFIYGLIVIIRDYDDVSIINELVVEHILFFMIGSMGLIGKFN